MNAILQKTAAAILVPGVAAILLTGCLFTVDGEPEDGGVLGGGNVFLASVDFEEDGLDPPGDDDDEGPELDTDDFGEYCAALFVCACEGLEPEQLTLCVETIAGMSESECLAVLESDYPECVPDSDD